MHVPDDIFMNVCIYNNTYMQLQVRFTRGADGSLVFSVAMLNQCSLPLTLVDMQPVFNHANDPTFLVRMYNALLWSLTMY